MDKGSQTKQAIIEVASELFAKNGFDNTSVRNIASQANVNIASINYHFKSKVGLYKEVLDHNISVFFEKIGDIIDGSKSCEEFGVNIFHYYIDESSTFYNSMKMFLINHLPIDKEIIPQKCIENPSGPPGTDDLMKLIAQETNRDINDDLVLWAARNIFYNIIHIALIAQSSFVKAMEKEQTLQNFEQDSQEEAIRLNIRATLNFLK